MILVMALLTVVVSVSLPNLKGFFHGRAIDAEARRLISLIRYGQDRAISEGVPMLLWIDERKKSYGLEAQPGYLEKDGKALQYGLADGLEIETRLPLNSGLVRWRPSIRGLGNVPMLRFMPDGFVSETSPDRITLRQGDENTIWIVGHSNRLSYAIATENELLARQ